MPRTIIGLGLAVVFSMAGCTKSIDTVKVTGTVTYKGKPLDNAEVMFWPEKGRPASGVTDASGKFALSTLTAGDGALVGKHTVTISEYYAPGKAPPMPGMGSTLPSRFPSKYSEPTQTPFTNVVVEAKGKNDFPFDIKD